MLMAGIILDGRRLKAFEAFYELGAFAGFSNSWLDELWSSIIADEELMQELFYYLDNHSLLDTMEFRGYHLTDLYVYEMDHSNVIQDVGKNTAACNKEAMILGAFYDMTQLKKNPEEWIKRLSAGWGMDKL